MQKPAIILDLDGVVADSSHRLKYADIRDWDTYDILTDYDTTYEWSDLLIEMIQVYNSIMACQVKLIFITARGNRARCATKDWLLVNFGLKSNDYVLYMRPDGDKSEDCVLKQTLYEAFVKDSYDVRFVIEDKLSNAIMWRKNGLVCLHMDPTQPAKAV